MELINLTKKVEEVLDLRKMPSNIKAQVCLAIDYSGSMSTLYHNGTVQNVVNRLSAIAVKFDDNKELDVLVFSDDVNEAESCTPDMFNNYVNKYIINQGFRMGGTNYSPFISKVVNNYFNKNIITSVEKVVNGFMDKVMSLFGKKDHDKTITTVTVDNKSKSGYPIFVIVVTDGENSDKTETEIIIKEMADKNIYWQFVGIGNESFAFLDKLNRSYNNVGFCSVKDIAKISDEDLYKKLLSTKFASWTIQHRNN